MYTSTKLEFTAVGCNRVANCIDYLLFPLPPKSDDEQVPTPTGNCGWVIFGANNAVGLVKVAEPPAAAGRAQGERLDFSTACKASPNVRVLKKHKGRVNAVAWIYDQQDQPCGIVSGDIDGVGVIFTPSIKGEPSFESWDSCEWEVAFEFSAHSSAIVALSAPKPSYGSRHSDNLLVTCSIDGTTRVWQWTNGEVALLQTITHKASYAMAVSIAYLPIAEPKLIFAIGNTDGKVRLFTETRNSHTFELSATLEGHEDWLRSVAFSSANEGCLMLASAGQDRSIRLWKLAPLSPENRADGLADVMARMGLGTRAHVFSVGCEAKWSAILDALLTGHDDWVYSVSWHPPQVRGLQVACLVSASADKSLMVWSPDQDTGIWMNDSQLGEIGGSTLGLYGGAFSPSGKALLAVGYKGALHLWHGDGTGAWAAQPFSSGHIGSVTSLGWDPSAAYLVTTSLDQTARSFAPCPDWGWREIARPQIHGYDLRRLAFIKPHQYACAAEEKVLRILDAPQPFLEKLNLLTGHEIPISTERHHGANLPALGLSNKAVALESLQVHSMPPYEEELLQTTLWPELDKLYGHGYEVVALAAAPDGSVIASSAKATSAEHANIHMFETAGFKALGVLAAHQLTVTCLAFSPCSTLLVSGSRDRSWSLFAKDTQSFALRFNLPKAHARIIWDIKFANDSQHILTGSRDKTVKVWRLADGSVNLIATIQFSAPVTALAVAPAINQSTTTCHFAVGLEDGSIGLGLGLASSWEMVDWISSRDTPSMQVNALDFQPTKSRHQASHSFRLAAASDDHSVHVYHLSLPPI